MSTVSRLLTISAQLKDALDTMPVGRSALIAQAILNAREDDSKLVKALKRRLALPPSKTEMVKINVSRDDRVQTYLEDLSERTQLPKEEIMRLAIEAHVYRL